MNKFDKVIKEDIIIASKNKNELTSPINGRRIAKKHLEDALEISSGEKKKDIENALDELHKVNPSPLFNSSATFYRRSMV